MRMNRMVLVAGLLTAGVLCLANGRNAKAQDSEILMPEQSAAKAKQILQKAIDSLGGNAYLNLRDVTCTGRLSQFGHSGDLNGFETFQDYAEPPDKDRTENVPKRNIISVFNGDKGWNLDRGGVAEALQADVFRFQEDTKIDTDNLLRHRIHEPGMIFRYGGSDIVDLHQVQWVELVDSENRTIRIAFSDADHLPVRKVVETRDPTTRTKSQQMEYYSIYHPISGIQTPFQITRERNGIKVYQVFFDMCSYNTGLADSMFTKESLDERWAKVGKKEREKEAKEKKKEDKADKDSKDSSLLH